MSSTGSWQVWDCGDLVASFTDKPLAEQCRTDVLDEEIHAWPDLAHLTACVTVIHRDAGPHARTRERA